jgi:hypothetical protein
MNIFNRSKIAQETSRYLKADQNVVVNTMCKADKGRKIPCACYGTMFVFACIASYGTMSQHYKHPKVDDVSVRIQKLMIMNYFPQYYSSGFYIE